MVFGLLALDQSILNTASLFGNLKQHCISHPTWHCVAKLHPFAFLLQIPKMICRCCLDQAHKKRLSYPQMSTNP